jgi:hypothetical protein
LSSILKALKKLEKESPSLEARTFWQDRAQPKKAAYDRLSQNWITHGRQYIICTLVLLVVAGGFMAVFRNAVFKKKLPGPDLEEILPLKKVPASPARPTAEMRPKPGEKPLSETFDRAVEKTEVSLGPKAETGPPAVKILEPRLDSRSGRQSRSDDKTVTIETAGSSETETVVAHKVLDVPGMKLQAISWSQQTETRLTVINNHIAHQGDRIDGYVVVQINPNDVIVSQGSDLWKIKFNPR